MYNIISNAYYHIKKKWCRDKCNINNNNIWDNRTNYNIFANGYWIGTVDANDTNFSIGINELPFTAKGSINISIEAFDQDGEVSPKRATVKV